MKIKMMATNAEFEVTEVGVFKPNLVNVDSLEVGQVGFFAAAIKMLKTHVSGIQLLMPIIRRPKHCLVIVKLRRWFSVVCIR